jgi:spermidine synthase
MTARPKLALVALLLAGCATTGGSPSPAPGGRHRLYEGRGAEPVVVTDETDGVRTLRFGRAGAIQSATVPGRPGELVLDYTRAAMVGLAFVPAPRRVLIVGLGGGTMATYLHAHFPEARIDAVEIDPEVLAVAKRFFGFTEDARVAAHVEDGRAFVERAPPGSYDLIFLDAYAGEAVPRHLATREFLAEVRERLAPGGVAIGNLWEESANPLYPAMVRGYQVEYPQVWELQASGNRIVVGATAPVDRATLRAHADAAASGRALGLNLRDLAAAITDITARPIATPPLADDPPARAAGQHEPGA